MVCRPLSGQQRGYGPLYFRVAQSSFSHSYILVPSMNLSSGSARPTSPQDGHSSVGSETITSQPAGLRDLLFERRYVAVVATVRRKPVSASRVVARFVAEGLHEDGAHVGVRHEHLVGENVRHSASLGV